MSSPCCWRGEDLLLECHVQPGAPRSGVVGRHDGRIKLRVQAPPVDGRANTGCVRYLAAAFGVPRRRVQLLAGARGRHKRFLIEAPAQLPEWLKEALDSGTRT